MHAIVISCNKFPFCSIGAVHQCTESELPRGNDTATRSATGSITERRAADWLVSPACIKGVSSRSATLDSEMMEDVAFFFGGCVCVCVRAWDLTTEDG